MLKLYEWALVRSQTLVRKMQGQLPQDSASIIPIVGQDTPTSTVPDDIPPLVEDAIHLIVYLTGSGDNPRPETVTAVFTTKKAIQEGAWSIEIGSEFLEAFSELAKQAKPVTARSLLVG